MRQTAFLAALFTVGTAFGADSQLMNLVMPDAKIMAGVNVTTAQISPFGQFVLSQLGGNEVGLQALTAATGFDPTKDVSEILVATNADLTNPSAIFLARGTFNVSQLVGAASKEKSAIISSYGGATLIASGDPKATQAIAFLGTSIALAGNLTSVKAAIDRGPGVNSISPQLAVQVQSLSATEDAWSVSLASIGSLIPKIGGDASASAGAQTLGLVKNIQSSSGGIKFGTNVDIVGQAVSDTPQDATALADIIRMVTSLAAMGAGQNPAAGAAAALLQKLQVSTNGAAVNITATLPEADLEAALKMVTAHASVHPAPSSATGHKL